MKKMIAAVFCILITAAAPVNAQGYEGLIPATAAESKQQKESERQALQNQQKIEKALKEMENKQKLLTRTLPQLEKDAANGIGQEWTPQQQEEYLKSLHKMNQQQQDLEDMARREMERANSGEDVTR